MAIALAEPELLIDSDGDVLYINDKTGEYDATSNAGGYGTPNEDLNDLCLALYVVRDDETPVNPSFAGTDQFVYDDVAANTKETNWQILIEKDGRYRVWLFMLQVSLDGTTYKSSGATIPEGGVYYYDAALHQIVSGVATPYSGTLANLVDDENYTQVYTEDFFQPEVNQKLWTIYGNIVNDDEGDCDLTKLYNTWYEGFANLMGADYRYRTNLTDKAREINEKNLVTLNKVL